MGRDESAHHPNRPSTSSSHRSQLAYQFFNHSKPPRSDAPNNLLPYLCVSLISPHPPTNQSLSLTSHSTYSAHLPATNPHPIRTLCTKCGWGAGSIPIHTREQDAGRWAL